MIHTIRKLLIYSILILFATHTAEGQPSLLSGKYTSDYQQALALYQKGQYGNAQRIFDKVVQEDFNNDRETRASSAYYATLCAMELYNADADMRVANFAQTYALNPLVNRLYFEYANYRFSLKRYRDAAEVYDEVDRYRLPKSKLDEYYFKKAYALLSIERSSEAKPLFFEIKDKNSKYAGSARYYYAHILYADSNYTEALSNFLPLQDDESFGPLVPYYLAHIYYRLNDYDKLLEIGEDLIENATPSRAPEIAKLMGDAFYEKGDYSSAVKYLGIYREKGGRMRQKDHFQLGYSQYKIGETRKAINSFNKIVAGPGKDDLQQTAYYHLGDSYLNIGEKQKAMTAFKAASEIKASPTIREDAFFNYAKLAYEFSDPYQDAITTLNQFLDDFPQSPHRQEVNKYLANLYVTTKDYERALGAIERTGMQSPAMKAAYQKIAFFRGAELYTARKYSAALNKLQESLKYGDNQSVQALCYYWIGETQYQLGEYDKALKAYEEFRKTPGAFNMTEFNRSYYQTAYCYYKKFDFQQAADNFRKYTRNASDNNKRLPDAYLRLADSYLLTGGYLVASDFYSSAIKTGTAEADYALFKRAQCLGLAGKNEVKVAELRELRAKYPKSIYAKEAQYEMAITYLQLEQYDKAIAALDQFAEDYPSSKLVSRAKLQKGLAYSNTDRNEMALNHFKEVVNDHPGTDEALEAVGLARLVYARQNRITDYIDWVDGLEFVNFLKPLLDSTAFNTAFDQYSSGNCRKALDALEDYLNRFPKGLFALKANYYLADCAGKLNREDLATTSYKNILGYELNDYTTQALHYLGRKALDGKDFVEARNYYERYAKLAASRNEVKTAQGGLMKAHYALGDYQNAALYADLVLNEENLPGALKEDARRIAAFLK
ncbi:MAG: tetratricopeptide repeat protein [Owenweeksia sp.]|nr:tetratricopeptide repeat protein [Owenweeksia sp.]